MAPTTPAGAVLALVTVALVALMGLWGLGVVIADIGESTPVTATVNQTNDSYQSVGGPASADRYFAPTVTNDTGELNDSAYTWNNSDGTILFNETIEDTSDPNQTYEQAEVNVTAVDIPDRAATTVSILEPLFRIPAWLLWILGPLTVVYGLWYLSRVADRSYRGPA